MNFTFDEEEFERDVKIKVVGVGGGGGNAVENMVKKNIEGVEFVIVNTDVAALKNKDGNLMERVQIGRKTTKGRCAGGKPPVAKESALENKDDIAEVIKGSSLVFVSAGMGGGTGTGAAPVIAQIAKEQGILTVGVVTKPFNFEREYKMNLALQGIAELRQYVDALVIIPNEKLLGIKEKNISVKAAYAMVDDVLYQAVKGISDLVNVDGIVNIDFEDVKSTLEDAGDAHMAIGHGTGDNRAEQAFREIVESPLLETSIRNCGRLLVNFNISEETPLADVDKVMKMLTEAAAPGVQVIHGVSFTEDDSDCDMMITVIATAFTDEAGNPMITTDYAIEQSLEGGMFIGESLTSISSNPANPSTPSTGGDDDRFFELENMLKNRN